MVIGELVPFLVESGYAPLKAATAFCLSGMRSVGGVISTGWLSHRYGLRPIALLSFACTFVGIFCLLSLSYYRLEWLLAYYVGLFGIAHGARGPTVAPLSTRMFTGSSDDRKSGVLGQSGSVCVYIGGIRLF